MIDDDFNVLEVGPIGANVSGLELKPLGVFMIAGLDRAIRAAGHAGKALMRQARTRPGFAVDEELVKSPGPGFDFG